MNDPLPRVARVLLLLAAGAWLATAVPDALGALARPHVPLAWWTARALGLTAHALLWVSMIAGVEVSSRGGGGWLPPAVATRLHARASLAGLLLTAAHVVVVVGDPRSGVGPLAAVLPLSGAPAGVALGSAAALGLGLVWATTVGRRALAPWVWRATHAAAFGVFLLATLHGVVAGSDAASPWARGLYVLSTATLVGAVARRVLVAAGPPDGVTGPG